MIVLLGLPCSSTTCRKSGSKLTKACTASTCWGPESTAMSRVKMVLTATSVTAGEMAMLMMPGSVVGVAVAVGVLVGVFVAVAVDVLTGVRVGVLVSADVGIEVEVAVGAVGGVPVGVEVGVVVGVAMPVGVGVLVAVGV